MLIENENEMITTKNKRTKNKRTNKQKRTAENKTKDCDLSNNNIVFCLHSFIHSFESETHTGT